MERDHKVALILAGIAGFVGLVATQCNPAAVYRLAGDPRHIVGDFFLPASLVWLIAIGVFWWVRHTPPGATLRQDKAKPTQALWGSRLLLVVNGSLALLMLFFFGSRGISYATAEQPFSPGDLVVIILTAVIVILTVLAIFLAAIGILGFQTLQDHIRKAVKEESAVFHTSQSKKHTGENGAPTASPVVEDTPSGSDPLPNDDEDEP